MKIILDTDIDTDCDDTGALAILHHYANTQETEILGIICSTPIPSGIRCLRAINNCYKQPTLPVGLVSTKLWEKNPSYQRYLDHRQTHREKGRLYNEHIGTKHNGKAPDAIQLYRKLLAEQPHHSITICAIGTLTALCGLLHSGPDEHSPLSGKTLIAQKVKHLISMARPNVPIGKDGFNWGMDLPAAASVIKDWPTPIVIQPEGSDVLTGARFMAAAPEDNPVKQAYQIWLGSEDQNRSSWDQLTLIYAVTGKTHLFTENTSATLTLDPNTGLNHWTPSKQKSNRILLKALVPCDHLSTTVEDLMIASLNLT